MIGLKQYFYNLIVRSKLVYYIALQVLPRLPTALLRFGSRYVTQRVKVHQVTDASGKTLKISRWNGKTYPVGVGARVRFVADMRIRDGDVLLCSYPKAGTHWVHEILHALVTRQAKLTRFGKEMDGMVEALPHILFDSLPSPRVLNSHLLYDELPREISQKDVKIVLLVRNPKDTAVSYYNHHRSMPELYGYTGEFEDHFRLFMDGRLEYGSYFDYLKHWDAVVKSSERERIFPLAFEDLKERPLKCIKDLARFLDVKIADSFANDVIDACKFEKLKTAREKQNKTMGKLYRKGLVGDWVNWLSEEQSQAIDHAWRTQLTGCFYQPRYC